jgi:AcrR family transcriptional regulator
MSNPAKSADAVDPRARLLRAAGPVFAQRGFDRATLREIAAAAEVNVAAVAYYYGDKMGLYREVIQEVRQSRDRRFPMPDNTRQEDPRVALARLVRTMLSRMIVCDESGWETQLMMREMDHPTTAFKELVNDFFRPLFQQLIGTLDRLIRRTQPESPVPEHTLEQLALSTVGQCLYYRVGRGAVEVLIPEQRRQQHFDLDSLSRHVTAVMMAATGDNANVLEARSQLDQLLSSTTPASDLLATEQPSPTNSDSQVTTERTTN